MFLRNFWYVAAAADEIGRTPFGRMILGEPVVLFRTEDGHPVAFEDRCPHRHLPLSMGKLVGDTLQCHYHGLRFGADGRCVRIPGQDHIPKAAKAKTYPVAERYHWIWIWMGDPALADPAAIPDFHWLDDPEWGAKSSYLDVDANWQLIVDNLLDLTHLAFVHETTIGNAAIAEHAQVKVDRAPNNVVVTRWVIDQDPPPTYKKVGGFTGNVDRWQIIDFAPPAFLRLDVGATPTGTGAPQGKRVGGISMRNLNAITPETETRRIISGGRRTISTSRTRRRPTKYSSRSGPRFSRTSPCSRPSSGCSISCQTRRKSTSPPMPAPLRPGASSTG